MGNAATKESPRAGSLSSASSTSLGRRSSATSTVDPSRQSGRASSLSGQNSDSLFRSAESSNSGSRRKSSKSKKNQVQPLVLDLSETVDGGYLQPQGVYTGPQDFKYQVVRELIVSLDTFGSFAFCLFPLPIKAHFLAFIYKTILFSRISLDRVLY